MTSSRSLRTLAFAGLVGLVGSIFSATNGLLACLMAATVLKKSSNPSAGKWRMIAFACSAVFLTIILSRIMRSV